MYVIRHAARPETRTAQETHMVSYIADDTADTIYKGGAAAGRTQKHRRAAARKRAPAPPVFLFLYVVSAVSIAMCVSCVVPVLRLAA